ncbi:hypothetical protein [Fimbriiglobus ruber]|uniref:Uncharacterized protein n=1 Tax=Fimbriiglobus ruber TaxID=1908690 RepID=A0A225DQZ3_9BACT|nr:hypothetical protein [Fimbriiglobus ruber]OWK38557.1 hypothetical protein FRUB_07677 [Fimbriiglobus ruber]
MRFPITSFVVIAVLAAAPVVGRAADLPCAKCDAAKTAPPEMVKKSFFVADLLAPIPSHFLLDVMQAGAITSSAPSNVSDPAVDAKKLIKLVVGMVQPSTWNYLGGDGEINFYEMSNCLIVKNTPEVVAEVTGLLEALRRLRLGSIAFECRLIHAPVGYREANLWTKNADPADPTVALLKEEQVSKLMMATQQSKDMSTMQLPKVTLFNNQTSTVGMFDSVTKTFLTGLEPTPKNANGSSTNLPTPKFESVTFGSAFQFGGEISADAKSVKMTFKMKATELDGPVALMPVTHMITPVFEGGSQGVPVPFTQFVQQPTIVRRTVDRTVTLTDGGTVAIPLGKHIPLPEANEAPITLRARLFRKVAKPVEQESIALVTVRVIPPEPEDTKPAAGVVRAAGTAPKAKAPAPSCPARSPAAEHVVAYRKACIEGRTQDAMKAAMLALAADPKCFADETPSCCAGEE